jgi:hypothetical protein
MLNFIFTPFKFEWPSFVLLLCNQFTRPGCVPFPDAHPAQSNCCDISTSRGNSRYQDLRLLPGQMAFLCLCQDTRSHSTHLRLMTGCRLCIGKNHVLSQGKLRAIYI